MNILRKLNKSSGARFGLCLAASMLWGRAASAEVTLVEKDGWTFSFDGRVNAFLSGGKGDDFPHPTTDSAGGMHYVMQNSVDPGNGRADVGWPSSYQETFDNKYAAVRVRSGMMGNILGFGIARTVSENVTIRGYISIWSTVESLGRDKWAPLTAEAREGFFTVTGNWGSVTAGRTLGWLGRTSYQIDLAYGHGFGVGLPCTDALGPACGHIGTGVLFPGYSAGMSYSTPSLGGLKLNVGIYDPVVFATAAEDWSHGSIVRPEGAITFDRPFGGKNRVMFGVEGVYQPIYRIRTEADMTTKTEVDTSIWGVSGGARLEVGPVRFGVSGFRGRGTGIGNALQRSVATADNNATWALNGTPTYGLRTFTGGYIQGALVFGKVQLSGGYGLAMVDQLAVDKMNPNLSVFRYQAGISGGIYGYVSDSVVLGLDYFHYQASWYGAPLPTGGKLAGEKQALDFLNAGVTYHW